MTTIFEEYQSKKGETTFFQAKIGLTQVCMQGGQNYSLERRMRVNSHSQADISNPNVYPSSYNFTAC